MSGWTDGQHLPPALAGVAEKFGEPPRRRADVAAAMPPGQARGMHEQPAGAAIEAEPRLYSHAAKDGAGLEKHQSSVKLMTISEHSRSKRLRRSRVVQIESVRADADVL